MEELIKITTREDGESIVSARELHSFLEIKKHFTEWFDDQKPTFIEGVEYEAVHLFIASANGIGGTKKTDFALTIDCAKQMAMISRTEKGKRIRLYFIEAEKKSRGLIPKFIVPQTFKEALLLAVSQQELIEEQTYLIEAQTTYIQEVRPKAEFYDQVTGSTDCFDMGSVAKVCNLGIGRNKMFEWLREEKILMQNNAPYQAHIDNGHFRVVETKFNLPDGTIKINIKTLVLQKGIEYIIKRYQNRKR